MALSGNLNTTKYDGRYYKLSWSATQSIPNNNSVVTWILEAVGGNSNWYAERDVKVVIDNNVVYSRADRVNRYAGEVARGTITLAHDNSGKKSFSVSVEAAVYLASVNCTGSDSFTLTQIAREATITSASSFTDEGTPKAEFSNPAGTNATVSIGLFWDKAGTDALVDYATVAGTSGTKTFTLTTAQKDAIYSKMANVKSKTIYYRIKTTIDSNNFTSSVAKTITITNATPTLNPTALENTDADDKDGSAIIAITGDSSRWIRGYSDIKYAFNASAKKGASIKKYSVKCGSQTATASTGTLYNIDSATVTFTVTDSRGNTATKTVTGTLIDYINLTSSLAATAVLDTSTTAKVTLKVSGNFYNGEVKAGTKNTLTLEYRYKESGGSYGNYTAITPSISGNKYSCSYTVPTSLDYQGTYVFQVRVKDAFNAVAYSGYVTSNEVVVKAEPVFDWGKDDFKFNVPIRRNFKTDNSNAITIVEGFNPDGSQRYRIGAHNLGNTNGALYLIAGTPPTDCWKGEEGLYIGTSTLKYNNMELCKNKILWGENRTVGYTMSDNQTVTLSEGVSKQANGIVLVFCHYASDSDTNRNYQYIFVPKAVIALTMGTTQVFSLSSLTFNTVGTKVLTFTSDTTITGSAGNLSTGTGSSGITYSNNKFVLRYVIGV